MDLSVTLLLLLGIIVYFYMRQKLEHNKLCEFTNCSKNGLNVSIYKFAILVVVLCLTLTTFSPVFSVNSAAAESNVLSENATSQTNTNSTVDTLYYASSKSDVYHVAGCRYVSQIKPENLITFNSIQEAEKASYRPCSVCIGTTPSPTPTPTPIPEPQPEPTPTPTPTPAPTPVTGNLTIHFIDVGQGDSILLEYGDNDMLIDAGDNGKGDGVANYVKSEGITSLDYVVATHPHEDHIGGMDVILNDFPIGKFIDSGYIHTTQTYEDMLNTISNKNIPFSTVKRGDKINFASGIVVQVLNPGSSYFTDDLNQNSVVLKVTDGKVSFLLMGDAGIEAENAIMTDGYNVNADILKVGHHGSDTSSSSSFISAVSPKVSVIEVGAGNEYGHPYAGILETLQKASTVYRTDIDDTVTVTTDGSTYTVTTEKTTAETESTGSSNSGSSGSHSSGGSHHSSGGSGGGTGGSPEPQKNVEVKDTTKAFISGDRPVYFNFTNDVTVVDYISFTSEKTVGKTTAITEDLKDKSSLVSELPDGIVYKSFNVWVGNGGYGDSDNILNAAISFKVNRSWIKENDIEPSSIVLYKYDGEKKEWEKLPVNLASEDNEFLHFTANVPGYSSFVITGEKGKQSTLESEPIATVKSVNVKDSTSTIAAKATEGNEKSPGFGAFSGIVCLVFVCLYRFKKR